MFDDILNIKDNRFSYKLSHRGNIMLNGKKFPLSIRKKEFEAIHDTIVKYDLKSGYECATAFGVSSTAAGIAFKKTGGRLITMDAYVEEHDNSWNSYRNSKPRIYRDSLNYRSARFLHEYFNLENNVTVEVGWSPNDVPSVLKRKLSENEKLDFVFIDAGHFPEQVIKDIEAIVPFLSEKHVLMFHDVFPEVFDQRVMSYLEARFGQPVEILVNFESDDGDNLGIMVNNI